MNGQQGLDIARAGAQLGRVLGRCDVRAYRHEQGLRLEAWYWNPDLAELQGTLWAQARVPVAPVGEVGPCVLAADTLARWTLHLAKEGFPGLPW